MITKIKIIVRMMEMLYHDNDDDSGKHDYCDETEDLDDDEEEKLKNG